MAVGCGVEADDGPLSGFLIGDWTATAGTAPAEQTLSITADFATSWEGREDAAFTAGSPDSLTLADGTVLLAVGGAADNGAIDADEVFESGADYPRVTLTFAVGGTGQRVDEGSAAPGDGVTTHYGSWLDDIAGSGMITLIATDTGFVSGTSRTITRVGCAPIRSRAFTITPGSPSSLAFAGMTFIAQNAGSTLVDASPWVMTGSMTGSMAGRTITLTVTADTIIEQDITTLPSGASSAGEEVHGRTRVWRHDYDGSSLTGVLQLRVESRGADYAIVDDGGTLRLTMRRLDAEDSRFTCVRAVTGLAHQIHVFDANWFRNGGVAGSLLGYWTDGGTSSLEFRADGTFTVTTDAAGSRIGHWRRSGRRHHYAIDEVFER